MHRFCMILFYLSWNLLSLIPVDKVPWQTGRGIFCRRQNLQTVASSKRHWHSQQWLLNIVRLLGKGPNVPTAQIDTPTMDIPKCHGSLESFWQTHTLKQHDKILKDIENMMSDIVLMDLLLEHRHLLNVDYNKFGEGKAKYWQLWLIEMESTVSAANHINQGSRQAVKSRYCAVPCACMQTMKEVVQVDNEGIIRWHCRWL